MPQLLYRLGTTGSKLLGAGMGVLKQALRDPNPRSQLLKVDYNNISDLNNNHRLAFCLIKNKPTLLSKTSELFSL